MIGFTKEVVFHPAKVNGVVVEKLVRSICAGKDVIVVFPPALSGRASVDFIVEAVKASCCLLGVDTAVNKATRKIEGNGCSIKFVSPDTMRGLKMPNVLVYSYDKVNESVIDQILHSNAGKLTVVEVR